MPLVLYLFKLISGEVIVLEKWCQDSNPGFLARKKVPILHSPTALSCSVTKVAVECRAAQRPKRLEALFHLRYKPLATAKQPHEKIVALEISLLLKGDSPLEKWIRSI